VVALALTSDIEEKGDGIPDTWKGLDYLNTGDFYNNPIENILYCK